MRYRESRLYGRSLRSLRDPRRLAAVHEAVSLLVERLERGGAPAGGLGLRKLRASLWEIRSSLADRVIFSWEGDLVTLLAAGTHADIKRFLSRT